MENMKHSVYLERIIFATADVNICEYTQQMNIWKPEVKIYAECTYTYISSYCPKPGDYISKSI